MVVSTQEQAAFDALARSMGLDPANRWVGGYVDYEWDHLRRIMETLPVDLQGLKVLEFGCNVGASAIVCARLGAEVDGIDVWQPWIGLARLNAERYGVAGIRFTWVPDSRALPFAEGEFDLVVCNSVLEYIDATDLPAVQRAIDRVVRPGGLILVTGTSNRFWPREMHSGKWLSNYLPRAVDRLIGTPVQRGIWPQTARHGFGRDYGNLDAPTADGHFFRWKKAIGEAPHRLSMLRFVARLLGVSPGLLAGSIFCLLRKPQSPSANP